MHEVCAQCLPIPHSSLAPACCDKPRNVDDPAHVVISSHSFTCITWSISMALLTTKVVRSFTYTPLSTFSFNSSLSLGSCVVG